MKLKRIFFGRAPGITESFTLAELSQQINVVVGPNGSGKTSLCRALAATLWPDQDPSTRLEVETVWCQEGRVLNAERHAGHVSWKVDGATVGPPSLPDSHLAACYRLSVRDLMQEDHAADRDIARHIRVQMAGGYDLKEVIDASFAAKQNRGVNERRKVVELRRQVREIRNQFEALGADEDRLVGLKEKQQQAKTAQQEQRLLEPAIELAHVRAEVADLAQRLTVFSADLNSFSGDEIERIDRLEVELAACDSKITADQAEVAAAEDRISKAHLSSQRPDETVLAAWTHRMSALREQERDLRSAHQQEQQRKAELAFAVKNLAGDALSTATPDVSKDALEEIAELVKQRDALTGRGTGLRAQAELLQADTGNEPRDDLLRAADILREWLSAPQIAHLNVPPWLLVVAAAGLVGGLLLAYFYQAVWLALSGVGIGIGMASIVTLLSIKRKMRADDRAEAYQEKYKRCHLKEPRDWSRDSILALLQTLEQRLAKANLADEQKTLRASIQQQLDQLKQCEAEHEKKRIELQQQLGVSLLSELTLADLMYRIRNYRKASEALISAQALVASLRKSCSEVVTDAGSFLTAFGYRPEDDAAGLEAQFLELKTRLNSYQSARELCESAAKRLAREQAQQQDYQARTAKFYKDHGLASGDREALARLLQQLPSYRELQQKHAQKVSRIDALEQKLSDRSDLLELTEPQAQQLSEEAGERASELSAIANEIGAIQSRVKAAREGNALEVASARLNEARGALTLLCEQAQHQSAGRFLLERVEHEHERMSRPPVMQQAADYFRRFTNNAYELRLPDNVEPEFSAWDTSAAKGLSLSQLSDGTRIQLLLAIRIAFALEAEQGNKIPFMLDEALSTADPERFKAVAQSLVVLAEEGRQIFYLTANPADVSAWKRVCSGHEPHIIDLAEVRGRQAAISDVAMLRIPPLQQVPEPGAMAAEEYAMAVRVTAASALRPVESLHLFYLLRDDLNSLYTLLHQTRISTVGQWRSLSQSGQAHHFLSESVCRRLDVLCRCARETYELRAIGRGRAIDAEVLRKSGAVSDIFMPRLASLASDLDGDCHRFLATFEDHSDERLKRFGKDAQQRLQAYLETNGYLDSRSVLSGDDIRLQVMVQAKSAIDAGIISREACGRCVDQLLSALDKSAN